MVHAGADVGADAGVGADEEGRTVGGRVGREVGGREGREVGGREGREEVEGGEEVGKWEGLSS